MSSLCNDDALYNRDSLVACRLNGGCGADPNKSIHAVTTSPITQTSRVCNYSGINKFLKSLATADSPPADDCNITLSWQRIRAVEEAGVDSPDTAVDGGRAEFSCSTLECLNMPMETFKDRISAVPDCAEGDDVCRAQKVSCKIAFVARRHLHVPEHPARDACMHLVAAVLWNNSAGLAHVTIRDLVQQYASLKQGLDAGTEFRYLLAPPHPGNRMLVDLIESQMKQAFAGHAPVLYAALTLCLDLQTTLERFIRVAHNGDFIWLPGCSDLRDLTSVFMTEKEPIFTLVARAWCADDQQRVHSWLVRYLDAGMHSVEMIAVSQTHKGGGPTEATTTTTTAPTGKQQEQGTAAEQTTTGRALFS